MSKPSTTKKAPKTTKTKPSGVEWLGDIPEHWELLPNRALFSERKQTVGKDAKKFTLLSLTNKGVIARNMVNPKGKFPAEFNTYKQVSSQDLIFCLFDIEETPRAIGIANQEGMITGAYTIFQCIGNTNPNYFYYYYLSLDTNKSLRYLYKGLRNTISSGAFASIKSPVPPKAEQDKIVAFLDRKTSQIDALIEKKQRLLKLLDEQLAIKINNAVTKGIVNAQYGTLNPHLSTKTTPIYTTHTSPLKNSGIEWIGDIPEEWKTSKIKYATKIFRGKFTHRPRNDAKLYNGEYPFIQTGDVARAEGLIKTHSQSLNKFGLRVSTLVPKNTIAMTIAANIGDVAILGFDACFPDSVVGFLPLPILEQRFLYFRLSSMKAHFLSLAPKNTQHNLNVERVGGELLPFPSNSEQKVIIKFLDNEVKAKSYLSKKINCELKVLIEMKSNLISKTVTGKILNKINIEAN